MTRVGFIIDRQNADASEIKLFINNKTEAAQPVQYRFSKNVTYVTSDGRVIEASKIRKDSKVRVHYIKQGDDMPVDKVIVSDRD